MSSTIKTPIKSLTSNNFHNINALFGIRIVNGNFSKEKYFLRTIAGSQVNTPEIVKKRDEYTKSLGITSYDLLQLQTQIKLDYNGSLIVFSKRELKTNTFTPVVKKRLTDGENITDIKMDVLKKFIEKNNLQLDLSTLRNERALVLEVVHDYTHVENEGEMESQETAQKEDK